MIEQACAEHGREIEDDHYGVLIPYANGPVPDRLLALPRPPTSRLADPSELVPSTWDELAALIERFVDVGHLEVRRPPRQRADGRRAVD